MNKLKNKKLFFAVIFIGFVLSFYGGAGYYGKFLKQVLVYKACAADNTVKETNNSSNVLDSTSEKSSSLTMADSSISGTATGGGLVKCGRSGGSMCTLCDLIVGIHEIIDYLLKIAIGIAVLAICIGGVLYVVSVGEPGMVEMGKNAMKNAIIGFVVALAAYLIVNVVMTYIGTNTDLGIGVQGWSEFDCSASK